MIFLSCPCPSLSPFLPVSVLTGLVVLFVVLCNHYCTVMYDIGHSFAFLITRSVLYGNVQLLINSSHIAACEHNYYS